MKFTGRVFSSVSAAWFCWLLILLLAWLAYRPGLSGGFLFDDFVNLSALGETGPIDDSQAFWRYITSGTADPTGRPLALLSFLLDARDWPADPAPFLRTNLLLHLINGSLLFLLLRALERRLAGPSPACNWIAALAAGLWLLHPLLVSTTLYVVQREAMLPTTFVLAGLLAYCHGRERLQSTQGRSGFAWTIAGLVGGTFLGVLSKANGILMPLLAWVLEATVFAQAGPAAPAVPLRQRLRTLRWLLILPSVLVFFYLIRFLPLWNEVPGHRAWTIGERLLTEARVLLDYLLLLVVPRSVSTGLFNDAYVASRGLLQPATTLPALLAILALAVLAVRFRRRAPAWAAAALFFLAGHLLESTVVPLELYFEHRNYLPALLLFWPVSRALLRMRLAPWTRTVAAAVLLGLFALTTWQRASIWGQPDRLARLWANRNPDSSRAIASEAIALMEIGQFQRARLRLDPLWRERPYDLQIALNYANAACASGGLSAEDDRRLLLTLRHADAGPLLVLQWLEKALTVAVARSCPGLDLDAVDAWIRAASANPAINTELVQARGLPSLLGRLALARGDASLAHRQFDLALATDLRPEVAAGQVALLASHEFFAEALAHLDHFQASPRPLPPMTTGMVWLHAVILERQQYWPKELATLRVKLERELGEGKH